MNDIYLAFSAISARERARERERICIIIFKCTFAIDLFGRYDRGSRLQQIRKRRINFPLAWNSAKTFQSHGRCAYDNAVSYFTF